MEDKKWLPTISDKQQVLLTQLSYLDFNIEQFEELKFAGKTVTISDLEELLTNPDKSYLGISDEKIKECVGDIKIPTQLEVIQQLKDKGLGELKVIDIASDPEITFKAIAFEDEKHNRGMPYSGTDFNAISQDTDDNLPQYLIESPEQIEAAQHFFKDNKMENGRNYLYGHSLGGNMASYTYMENYNQVERAFTVNALPVKPEKINQDEKIIALSDGEKHDCNVIGGDCASQLEDESEYWFNVNYVKNRLDYLNSLNNSFLSSHLLESATYDDDGEFITLDKGQAYMGRKYKLKPEVTKEETSFSFEEAVENFYLKLDSVINRVVKFSKDMLEKVKALGKRIFPKDTKLLTDGSEKRISEDQKRTFREELKVDIATFDKAIEQKKDNPVVKGKNEKAEENGDSAKQPIEDNIL